MFNSLQLSFRVIAALDMCKIKKKIRYISAKSGFGIAEFYDKLTKIEEIWIGKNIEKIFSFKQSYINKYEQDVDKVHLICAKFHDDQVYYGKVKAILVIHLYDGWAEYDTITHFLTAEALLFISLIQI